MFALMMSEDRISMQPRRKDIIDGLKLLPGEHLYVCIPSVDNSRHVINFLYAQCINSRYVHKTFYLNA